VTQRRGPMSEMCSATSSIHTNASAASPAVVASSSVTRACAHISVSRSAGMRLDVSVACWVACCLLALVCALLMASVGCVGTEVMLPRAGDGQTSDANQKNWEA
jgi:hypothetical protein